MELSIFQVDAFTDTVFKGNPAAVVPLSDWIDESLMMNIAAENNLAETAFFVPLDDEDEEDFHIRWFTPTQEVELCGHATLATAHILWEKLGFQRPQIRLKTSMAGPLSIRKNDELIELNFPIRPSMPADLPDGFEERLNIKPVVFHRALKNMAVLENAQQVRDFEPDLDYIASLPHGDGLIITAPADGRVAGIDCVSRYFCPAAGIDEDSVTGSAHCTIVPYWSKILGKTDIHALQASRRSGTLLCKLDGERLLLSGQAKIYLEGKIWV